MGDIKGADSEMSNGVQAYSPDDQVDMKFNLNGKRSSSRIQGDVRQSDLAKKSRILNGDTPGQHSDAKDTDMLDLKLNICPEDSPSVVAPPILKIPKIEPAATEDHHNKENGVDMTNFLSNAMDLSALKAPGSTKPLDLTSPRSQTHSTSSKQTDPEIITLSDSEDEFQEVLQQALKLRANRHNQLLRKYQSHLRAEETKLILLKKLKQSLNQPSQPAVDSSHKGAIGDVAAKQSPINAAKQSTPGNAPPPLRRGQYPSSNGTGHVKMQQSSSNHQLNTQQQVHSMQTKSQQNGGSVGPPPLVHMPKTASPHRPITGSTEPYGYQSQSATSKEKKKPELSKEQKRAAAKIAIRKQLEQSLIQIAPPKPPPPEVNFLPSLQGGEFVCLIGMEEVVKHLLSSDQKEVKYMFNPFTCVQCSTDFTPVWKRDKPGSKNVICERCITSNQKQILKQEHTAKLKAAFVKSLQQEQDIERRITAGSPLSDMPGLSAIVNAANQSASQTTSSTPMPQLTPSQQQIQQQHALLQAQAAEQMRAMLAAQAMALPYQLYGMSNKQASDLQRQYLLDMINPSRSSWKT